MKLRSTLSITEPMPEVDPAIYNLRFANKLSFPNAIMTNTIAADASKLIRRFAADWMTQGRRPAGLCGACLIIAGRMHNFLRTPDEVAQVVKTSPLTIQKRLKEFAQTSIAKKTVEEFRNMSEQELFQDNEEVPPIVKEQRERERRRQEKERRAELARQRAEGSQAVDEQAAQASGSQAGTPAADGIDIDAEAEAAVRQVMEEYDVGAEGSQAADEEDDNLEPMNAGDYRRELDAAGDDPKAAQAEWQRERSSFLRSSMPPASMSATLVDPATMSTQMTFVDPGLDPALSKAAGKRRRAEHDEVGEGDQGEDEDELAELGDKEEGFNPASSPLAERDRKPARREFTEWDDEPAMIQYLEETYFAEDVRLLQLTKQDVGTRIREWLKGRDPREVIREMTLVEGAYKARERGAKVKEEAFPDIDDDELDRYWVMEEDERDTRARMWLSSNGKWLEEEKGELSTAGPREAPRLSTHQDSTNQKTDPPSPSRIERRAWIGCESKWSGVLTRSPPRKTSGRQTRRSRIARSRRPKTQNQAQTSRSPQDAIQIRQGGHTRYSERKEVLHSGQLRCAAVHPFVWRRAGDRCRRGRRRERVVPPRRAGAL